MHCGSAIGKAGTPEEALKETQYEKACKIVDKSGRNRYDDKDKESDDVHRASTNDRDLTHGCKKQWAYTVGEDVK